MEKGREKEIKVNKKDKKKEWKRKKKNSTNSKLYNSTTKIRMRTFGKCK